MKSSFLYFPLFLESVEKKIDTFFILIRKVVVLMTERQKRFADEYIIDLNATRAYKVAYPSVKKDESAAVNASKLLRNTNVKEYIEKRLAEIADEKIADASEVMEYLTKVMRGEGKEEVVAVEGQGEGYSSACIVEKAINIKDRIKAAELLGKRYSLFTDKIQLNSDAVVQIIDDVPGDEDG